MEILECQVGLIFIDSLLLDHSGTHVELFFFVLFFVGVCVCDCLSGRLLLGSWMGLCLGLRKACAGLCSCIMASDISRDCSPCSSGKKCFLHSYTLWVLPSMNHPTRYQIPPLSTVPCGKKEQLSAGPFIVHDLR